VGSGVEKRLDGWKLVGYTAVGHDAARVGTNIEQKHCIVFCCISAKQGVRSFGPLGYLDGKAS